MGNFFNQLDQHLSNKGNAPTQQSSQMPEMVDTLIGRMPKRMPEFQSGSPENKAMIEEMIGWGAGAPGMKMAAEGAPVAKAAIKKGWDYIHPEKAAEKFRSEFGQELLQRT